MPRHSLLVTIANPLARFAVESGRITSEYVKPKLFEPNVNLEVSVFRVVGRPFAEVQQLGVGVAREHPTSRRDGSRRLYGWGILPKVAVGEIGLDLHDDEYPTGHSNIVGWPKEASKRKLLQQLLAQRSEPVRLDPPIEVGS